MDKFGKEKAKALDVVKNKGAYPKGIDIHKDDEFLGDADLKRPKTRVKHAPPRDDPASPFVYFGDSYIRRDAIPALLHAQRQCLCGKHFYAPIKKRRKAFSQALKAAGFRSEQISYAFAALLNGVVIPEPLPGDDPSARTS